MTNLKSLFFVPTLFFCLVSNAQENTLLWEITGKDLKKPSYLFGTMHVKDKRAFQFHDSLLLKLTNCESFAGEIVLDKTGAKGMAGDLLLPPGKDLKTLLSKNDYKKVKKYCSKNLGALALVVNKVKPVFTSALISESLLSNDMPKALDEYLQDVARKNKRTVRGLETIAEQLTVLDDLPVEDQAKLLVEQIENIDLERTEIQRMADIYASQNLDSIYSFIQTPELTSEYGDVLIKNRNLNMAIRLEQLILVESVFCAVGAAHLPGEFGIINLLRKKGYSLRPMYK